jgi:hypothetical protein
MSLEDFLRDSFIRLRPNGVSHKLFADQFQRFGKRGIEDLIKLVGADKRHPSSLDNLDKN